MAYQVLEQLVECLGTKVEVAKICGVRPPSLHGWKKIPAHHVLVLEKAVKAKGGDIDRYSMRPDIFGDAPQTTERKSVA